MTNRKKYWMTILGCFLASVCLFMSGFLLAHQLVIQKTTTVVNECFDTLEKKQQMLRTWCVTDQIRIGQCEEEIYVCLCASPDDFDLSE